MSLLDSFIKESTRVNPLDNGKKLKVIHRDACRSQKPVSTRRKALQPFTLSDGTHIKAEEWLATPLAPMLRDEQHWSEPLAFHRFRHVDALRLASLENRSAFQTPDTVKAAFFIDVSKWQTWGTGRMAW